MDVNAVFGATTVGVARNSGGARLRQTRRNIDVPGKPRISKLSGNLTPIRPENSTTAVEIYRKVLISGARGRRFESSRSDHRISCQLEKVAQNRLTDKAAVGHFPSPPETVRRREPRRELRDACRRVHAHLRPDGADARIGYMPPKIPHGRFPEIDTSAETILRLVTARDSFATGAALDHSGGRARGRDRASDGSRGRGRPEVASEPD